MSASKIDAPRSNLTVEEWEDDIFCSAVYFTTCKFLGRGKYAKREWKTFPEAVKHAASDNTLMLYAVTAQGHQTLLTRSRWLHYLQLWTSNQQ